MSNDIVLPEQPKALTLRNMLEQYKPEIVHALPRGFSPDRMLRIALTSARKTPALLECTPESFLGAVIQSAQLGLEPDTPLGHAYLVPYRNKSSAKKEVNFMPGYRGFMELVYRTPQHPIIMPEVVYEGDKFSYSKGLHPTLVHDPLPRLPTAKLTHAYVIAGFPDGRREFWVMTRHEIEEARGRSKATGFSPWQTDYGPMAMKSCIRRICKYLPMSAEIQTAVNLDEAAEDGRTQHNNLFWRTALPHTKSERVQNRMGSTPDDDPESFGNFKPEP